MYDVIFVCIMTCERVCVCDLMKILKKQIVNGVFALMIPAVIGSMSMMTMFEQADTVKIEYSSIEKLSSGNITIGNYENNTNIKTENYTKEEKEKVVKLERDVPVPNKIPEGIIYPKPTNMPILRDYDINKDSNVEIWHAQDPTSYIIPNNEWVKYVASQLYVDDSGRIKYKNSPVPLVINFDGRVLKWTDKPFVNNYVTDNDLFDYPANADLWQNADYYLSHGMRGDCEDWAISTVSMMLSGEMSIKDNDNGSYVKQVIPAKAVMGKSGRYLDSWVEYKIGDKKYLSSTGTMFNPGTGEYESITSFHEEGDWDGFFPIYQFTDKYFGKYNNKN